MALSAIDKSLQNSPSFVIKIVPTILRKSTQVVLKNLQKVLRKYAQIALEKKYWIFCNYIIECPRKNPCKIRSNNLKIFDYDVECHWKIPSKITLVSPLNSPTDSFKKYKTIALIVIETIFQNPNLRISRLWITWTLNQSKIFPCNSDTFF